MTTAMERLQTAPEFEWRDSAQRHRGWAEWSLRLLGTALGLALTIIVFYPNPNPKMEKAGLPSPPKLSWAPVVQPTPLYGLDAPDWLGPPGPYAARSHFPDGGRDDSVSFGRFSAENPLLRLSIYRAQQEDLPTTSFFLDLTRMAAESGLWVGRSTITTPLATRFGIFEAADLALAERDQAGNCLGFRFLESGLKLRIVGFYCGTAMRPADRDDLACLIDRLNLLSGDDPVVQEFFAQAEPRQTKSGCLSRWPAGGGQTNDEPGAFAKNTATQ
jgi:hypothetical protein